MAVCGLCKYEKILCDSHLISKSFYGALRNAYPDDGKEVVICQTIDGSSVYSDRQVKSYFLCADCEQLFSKNGENVVSKECHKGQGIFGLLDKVRNANKVGVGKGFVIPDDDGEIDYRSYLYFASSIVWRASAGNWPDLGVKYKGALGSKYEEQLRKYLLGNGGFPENMYLGVYVDGDQDIMPIISFPILQRNDGFRGHTFHIPGVKFALLVGAKVPAAITKIYRVAESKIVFSEYSFKNQKEFDLIHRKVKYDLKPRGRLAKEMENV